MCVVSMVSDHFTDKWKREHPDWWQGPHFPAPTTAPFAVPPVSREEFDALKREVVAMKELLKRAADYDKRNNEPDCHLDEKIAMLRKIADAVGVDLDEVFGSKTPA